MSRELSKWNKEKEDIMKNLFKTKKRYESKHCRLSRGAVLSGFTLAETLIIP